MEMMLMFSAASGWFAAMLLIATTALPYLARPTAVAKALHLVGSWTNTFLDRMRPHAWLGYTIIALSVLHAVAALGGGMRRADPLGLWLAAVGLLALFAQWLLGARLMQPALSKRRRVRRWHFALMIGAGAAIFAHAYLNGALIRAVMQ
jgi:hypothetical protein